jgi:hypothetical protein
VAALATLTAACGDADSGETTDTGVADAGVTDAGTADVTADASDTSDTSTSPEIQGVWVDGFGFSHWVTAEQWQSGWGPTALRFVIVEQNDDAMWLVAENDADNEFNPGLFSRFEWTFSDEQLYYCQSVFDAPSADDAATADPADASDLESGCNGFGWSSLTEGQGDLAIVGTWTDGFGTHTVDDAWTQDYDDGSPLAFVIVEWNNVERWLVAQNASDNAFYPDLFSRFEWTWTDTDDLAYCQSSFDAETADDARNADRANLDDLDTGCAGFSWSTLSPVGE